MTGEGPSWAEACRIARLLAVDPSLGLVLRGPAGAARDHWIAGLRGHLPETTPWRRLPAGTPSARLAGGLDLAATLAAGCPVSAAGLLAEADGGVLVIVSAERLDGDAAALIGHAIETGVTTETVPARFGIVALDEGRESDERTPDALTDRLALRLDLGGFGHRDCGPIPPEARAVATARRRLASVTVGDDAIEALCLAALALGVAGLRAPILALKTARAAAALDDRSELSGEDIALAARLVLGPRATRAPAAAADAEPEPDVPSHDEDRAPADAGDPDPDGAGRGGLAEIAVEAARTTLPADLVAGLAGDRLPTGRAGGRGGAASAPARRGRPLPSRRGRPDRDRSLDVLATLRAAAPWQRLRGRTAGSRVLIRPEDLRVRRFEDHQRTTVIVAVDASGSAALHRLAEAKGAVELILAECYLARDEVALVTFRGTEAEVLLPPTRALARAKRELAALPGGGGTPLAAGLALAFELARAAARDRRRPVLAVLTDGRANIARDGTGDRTRATAEATAMARMVRAAGWAALVVDVSPRPGPAAAALATEMGAGYLPLPHAGARAIAGAVLERAGAAASVRSRA